MAGKPVLLTVDDDAAVSQALTRDLRRQYAQRFRVVRAESGPRALEILRELRLAEEEAALLLADHRMPGMTGVEFLEQLARAVPDCQARAADGLCRHRRRHSRHQYGWPGLLPAQAVEPAGAELYPVLDELIEDWLADYNRHSKACV